jgi:hypothetical protein
LVRNTEVFDALDLSADEDSDSVERGLLLNELIGMLPEICTPCLGVLIPLAHYLWAHIHEEEKPEKPAGPKLTVVKTEDTRH